jgi:hypothetical protein
MGQYFRGDFRKLAGKLLYESPEKAMISLDNFKYPGDMAVPGKRIGRF